MADAEDARDAAAVGDDCGQRGSGCSVEHGGHLVQDQVGVLDESACEAGWLGPPVEGHHVAQCRGTALQPFMP